MIDTFGAAFGRLVKRKRAEKKLTQAQLAAALYLNLDPEEAEKRKGDISKLENGKVPNPTTQTIQKLANALDISEDDLDALQRRVQMSPSEKLDNVAVLDRDQLELLAGRFEIEKPHALSDPDLRDLLTKKAEEYRALKEEVDAIDDGLKRLSNLKTAAADAIARIDLDEVEELLSRVQEVELEEAAKTAELRANNALLRGKVEQAYQLLSAAADSFAAVDPLEPARRRILKYFVILINHGLRFGGLGLPRSRDLLAPVLTPELKQENGWLWAAAHDHLAIALGEQGTRTDGEAGTTLLTEAVAAYREALTIRTRADHPVDWAKTQNNLANALENQGTRTGGEAGTTLLAEAVAANRAALTIRTREDHPVQWAMTQNNLALAEEAIADHDATADPRGHLEAALTHVEDALTVYDPEHMSYDHGTATDLRDRIKAKLATLKG